MSEPFEDVDFRTEHRAASVADHEVLMAFVNDNDALSFREWWHSAGKFIFGEYVRQPSGRTPGVPTREEMYRILKQRSKELLRGFR